MKYIKANGIDDNELYYFEIDERGAAYRQVSFAEGRCRVSIAPDFQLCETEVEIFDGDEEITPEAFEEVWHTAVEPYKNAWEETKRQYRPGTTVTGTIQMFYPQGVIIRLDGESYAVANDPVLRMHTPPAWMYPGYQVEGTVGGADESNFWIKLESCRVTGKRTDS